MTRDFLGGEAEELRRIVVEDVLLFGHRQKIESIDPIDCQLDCLRPAHLVAAEHHAIQHPPSLRLRTLLQKLFWWRVDIRWYLVALLLPVAVRFTALGLLYLSENISSDLALRPWRDLFGVFLLMLVLVPLEEIGWRGYALPRLRSIYGTLWGSLALGALWALWHLPLVWVQGSYQESRSPLTYMLIFTVTILPVSVLFTWLYDRTQGSLLLASLFHASINLTEYALIIRARDGRLVLLIACALNTILAAMFVIGTMRNDKAPMPRSRLSSTID